MLKPEDKKLWDDVMAGVTRIVSNSVRHAPPKLRIPIRDVRTPYTLDLHGMTVQEAHDATMKFIWAAYAAGYKYVTVITGLSGQIRHEFERWLFQLSIIREVKPVNGGGAFKVKFFKKGRK